MCNFSREIEIRCKMDVEKNDRDKNLRPFVDLMNLKKELATLKMNRRNSTTQRERRGWRIRTEEGREEKKE